MGGLRARLAVPARQGGTDGVAVGARRLHRGGRSDVSARRAPGPGAARRWDHHLGRLADRDRQQAERAPAGECASTARRRGPRDRRGIPGSRWLLPPQCHRSRRCDVLPLRHGDRRHARHGLRVSDGPNDGARGARARDPHGVRACARCQQQSEESRHQPAVVRREPAARRESGRGLRARHPGKRYARHGQALPRPRRYGAELPSGAVAGERFEGTAR
jgi:hypothetical protein